MSTKKFSERHIGPRENDVKSMLSVIGVASIEELINQTIPSKIRLKKELELTAPMTEYEYLNWFLGGNNLGQQTYLCDL